MKTNTNLYVIKTSGGMSCERIILTPYLIVNLKQNEKLRETFGICFYHDK